VRAWRAVRRFLLLQIRGGAQVDVGAGFNFGVGGCRELGMV